MTVVMYRDVPTKTGVRSILVDEKDAEALKARGWKMKEAPKKEEPLVKEEPKTEAPVSFEKKGKKKRR